MGACHSPGEPGLHRASTIVSEERAVGTGQRAEEKRIHSSFYSTLRQAVLMFKYLHSEKLESEFMT